MKIALVSMPWSMFDAPSAALGVLSSYISNEGKYEVDCKSEHLRVWKKMPAFYDAISRTSYWGDFFYAVQLYPEMKDKFKKYFLMHYNKYKFFSNLKNLDKSFDESFLIINQHLDDLTFRLIDKYDIIGLTLTYSQLFASVALSKKLKEFNKNIKIVFGGCGYLGCEESIIKEYPYIDYFIKGEGEKKFIALIKALLKGTELTGFDGILTSHKHDQEHNLSRDSTVISNLDNLITPNYDDYYDLAEKYAIVWNIPIESSRGCWWNRTLRTCNSLNACYFCNLNSYSMYRQKTVKSICSEMLQLSNRYKNTRFRFQDNIFRRRGGCKFSSDLLMQRKNYRFFMEVRADADIKDFLCLMEAGCYMVQIGIEGLSTKYLKRINKGTTTIQNLQAMRICFELGLDNKSNLLIEFPGATNEEVKETNDNILRFATAYPPLEIVKYCLGPNSSVALNKEIFGISNIHNAKCLKNVIPLAVYNRLDYLG